MTHSYRDSAKRVLQIERDALVTIEQSLDANFDRACDIMAQCRGKVIVSGMGKSGHIGNKIAATLASTGTPAFFMHPGEASHGDLGMLSSDDAVLAISHSGETAEIAALLPVIKRLHIPIIAMTGNPNSTLARHSDVHVTVAVDKEACSLGLAPTASTTATLAMGDALAIALLDASGFTPDDFALSHPGGSLGRKLLLTVADIMRRGPDIPKVAPSASLAKALMEMSQKGLGMTAVVGDDNRLAGIFTDGDLRRVLDGELNLNAVSISSVMTPNGIAVNPDMLAVEALNTMEEKKISGLFVVNDDREVVGALHMHLLLQAGVV